MAREDENPILIVTLQAAVKDFSFLIIVVLNLLLVDKYILFNIVLVEYVSVFKFKFLKGFILF